MSDQSATDLLQLKAEELHRSQTGINTALKVLSDFFTSVQPMTQPLVSIIEQYRGIPSVQLTKKPENAIFINWDPAIFCFSYCKVCQKFGHTRIRASNWSVFNEYAFGDNYIMYNDTHLGNIIIRLSKHYSTIPLNKLPSNYIVSDDKSSFGFKVCPLSQPINTFKDQIFTTMVSEDEKAINELVEITNAHKPGYSLQHNLLYKRFVSGRGPKYTVGIFRQFLRRISISNA
jgi:hypothetical protein